MSWRPCRSAFEGLAVAYPLEILLDVTEAEIIVQIFAIILTLIFQIITVRSREKYVLSLYAEGYCKLTV